MNQRSRLSLLVIQILVISLMVSLIGRLFYLQVAAGPKYRDAALSIQSRDIVSPANRGLIVDSSGVPLALNKVGLAVTVDRLTLDKQPDKGASVLTKVAKLLVCNMAMFIGTPASAVKFSRAIRQVVGLVRATNQFLLLAMQIPTLGCKLSSGPMIFQVLLLHQCHFVIIQAWSELKQHMYWAMSAL